MAAGHCPRSGYQPGHMPLHRTHPHQRQRLQARPGALLAPLRGQRASQAVGEQAAALAQGGGRSQLSAPGRQAAAARQQLSMHQPSQATAITPPTCSQDGQARKRASLRPSAAQRARQRAVQSIRVCTRRWRVGGRHLRMCCAVQPVRSSQACRPRTWPPRPPPKRRPPRRSRLSCGKAPGVAQPSSEPLRRLPFRYLSR